MSTTSTTTLANILKTTYLDGMPNFENTNKPWMQRLERVTGRENFEGDKIVFAGQDGSNQGGGEVAEGGAIPEAGNMSLVNMELQMKHHYWTIRLTAQIIEQAANSKGAFGSVLDKSIMDARTQSALNLAWHSVRGAGYGDLGRVLTPSTTTVTLRDQPTYIGLPGARFIRKGVKLDSYSALTGGVQGASGVEVTQVTTSTDTITVASGHGMTAGDYVFRKGSRGNSVMGLKGLVDDGTILTSVQNLSRSTNPMLNAGILSNSGTLRAWTPELMDQGFSEAWNNGGGYWPSACMSPLEIQQRAAAYLRNDRRVAMTEMELDNGYKTVSWTTPDGNKPWLVDQFATPNEIMYLREEDLFFAILHDWDFVDEDGSKMRIVDRTHAFEMWLYTWRNLGARQFNNHSLLKDVSHTL